MNPRLTKGLPQFYRKHLGENNNNQLWLATHSDALLREAVKDPEFSVFHMKSSLDMEKDGTQLVSIKAETELDSLLSDLIGDLAAQPRSKKVVIFEGGGNSDFDVTLVRTLFPDLNGKFISISGENKIRVGELLNVLEKAKEKNDLPYTFYSISDKDSDTNFDAVDNQHCWDRYHIENYLLEPEFVFTAIHSLSMFNPLTGLTMETISDFMKKCAEESTGPLLEHLIRKEINHRMVSCLRFGIDPGSSDLAAQFQDRIQQSFDRIKNVVAEDLTADFVRNEVQKNKHALHSCLSDGTWIEEFRGRDILRRVVTALNSQYKLSVQYDQFVSLIVTKMTEKNFRPVGMQNVLMKIVEDE